MHTKYLSRFRVSIRVCLSALRVRLILAIFLAGALVLAFADADPAQAASILKMDTEDLREMTWKLNADRMVSLAGGDILEAVENVELRMGGDVLRADFARYYVTTNWVYLSGNVELIMGGDRLRAEEAEFNLNSKTGWLMDGEIYLAEPHAYFKGERVTKHWGNVYSFRNAKVTACSGVSPAWSFTADNAVVEIDGYAQLWGAAFQVKDVPVLYSPYAVLPAKTSRQTGFLMPEFGHSSTRGYYYNQPFFWAIDNSRDLTVNEYYMSRHGFMHGLNYRSKGAEDEALWLRLDFINDRVTDNDGASGEYDGDAFRRQNHSRYWLRGMYDWNLPGVSDWKIRADLDWVSDQDFLREFNSASFGFARTRLELFDEFARDFTEITEKRRNTLMLFREWERASLYLSGVYTQNQYLDNGNADSYTDDTVQMLPELDLYLHKGRILENLPLELQASAQGGYYYRRSGTRGTRFDVSPTLSLPLNGKYGSFMVSAGFNSTWYNSQTKAHNREDQRVKKDAYRFLPAVSADASTEFSRVFQLAASAPLANAGESRWTALRHSVVPRVSYENRSTDEQVRNPDYDRYDRLKSVNELTYGVDNVITRKREQLLARQGENGEQELYSSVDYLDILRLRLEQTYDIRESRRDEELYEYRREPWRDVMAELSVAWDHLFTLSTRTFWSPENNRLTRHEHGIRANIPDFGFLYAGMDFRQKFNDYEEKRYDDTKRMIFEGDINFYGPFSVLFYYDWIMRGRGESEKGLSLLYKHECFTLLAQVHKEDKETDFRLMVRLDGLLGQSD